MNQTQVVHTLFRGSAEVGKICRRIAFALEIGAAGAAFLGVFSKTLVAWLPLTSFLFLAAAMIFRVLGERYKEYSDNCRQISMRAFGKGKDVAILTSSNLRDEAPLFTAHFAGRLPAYKIEDYYDVQSPPGDARVKEVYAYSSYYSSRLLRVSSLVLGIGSAVVIVGAIIILYALVEGAELNTKDVVLNALFSIVLSVCGLRTLEDAFTFFCAAKATKGIADALIDSAHSSDDLRDLAFQYEATISSAPPIPTVLYRILRKRLDAAWQLRRTALLTP